MEYIQEKREVVLNRKVRLIDKLVIEFTKTLERSGECVGY